VFAKLKVLESKLDIYEDLSKEMLDKLERAVSSIQDNSNKVAIILERHENRLDEGDKANQAIIKMINDHQIYDEKMFNTFSTKLQDLDKKVDELQKGTWTVIIGASAVILLIQLLPAVGLRLTPAPQTSMMSGEALVSNGSDRHQIHWSHLSKTI
jgi:polyhydroxyalkanoate synthesis regulator phasin